MCEKKIELETTYVTKTENLETETIDEDTLFMNTLYHKDDVEACMKNIASYIEDIGEWHDWSKLEYFNQFSKDVEERKDTKDFKQREWYKIHTTKERHHINAHTPEDVNLFDVLEMIVDCIIAGKTRSGTVNMTFLEIPTETLIQAYWNTVRKLDKHIQCKKKINE